MLTPQFNRFVTRPDVKKERLAEFLDWCLIRMEKAKGLYPAVCKVIKTYINIGTQHTSVLHVIRLDVYHK